MGFKCANSIKWVDFIININVPLINLNNWLGLITCIHTQKLNFLICCKNYVLLMHIIIIFVYFLCISCHFTLALTLHDCHASFRLGVLDLIQRIKHFESDYFPEFY